jgi:cell division protease FtsH
LGLRERVRKTVAREEGPVDARGETTKRRQDLRASLGSALLGFRRLFARKGGKGGSGNFLFKALVVGAVLLFAGLAWGAYYVYVSKPVPGQQLYLSDLQRLAGNSQVYDTQFLAEDNEIIGSYCTGPLVNGVCPSGKALQQYHVDNFTSDVDTPVLIDTLSKNNNGAFRVDQQSGKGLVRFLITFLAPLMILADLFGIIFLARSGQGSISDIVGFGSIGRRKKNRLKLSTGVTFADVAGADEAVIELREVRDYLLDPNRYEQFGAQPPKGVLLFGPPGCGKTLLARAVAGESGVPFFSVSGAEFVESLVGVGAARVRDLFKQARAVAPAIIFIDEIDAVGRKRGGGSGGTDEREQTLNQMLVAMDGFEITSGIVVMGATNRPDILDPALLRPGRFDRHVTIDEPDLHGRIAILELHARNIPMAEDVDLESVARRTPGFTGADLANVINESALLGMREGHVEIYMPQLTEAIQRVVHGPQRRGRIMTVEESKRVAFHESGHALVASALGHSNDVQRLSVVARGRGLGQSTVGSDADRVLLTRSELENQMTMRLGGMAAEEVRFGEPSTASEDDVDKVTDLARQMVGRYGMSAEIGTIRLMGRDTDVFLQGESAAMNTVSGETLQGFDKEVRRIVDAAKQRAIDLLVYHQEHLERLAERLEESETLEGTELEVFLAPVRPEMNFVAAGAPAAPRSNGKKAVPAPAPVETTGAPPS